MDSRALIAILQGLPHGSAVYANDVGNLVVHVNGEYIGWIDLADGVFNASTGIALLRIARG